MTGKLKVLDARGHTTVEYDTDASIVAEAEKVIAEEWRKRSAFFDGQTKERIRGGAPNLAEHEEILIVPAMAGGC